MEAMATRKRAAAYCRVSTGMECQEGSYETQIRYYRAFISDDLGEELVGIYADEGSGRSTRRRPEFQRMMRDCADGKIDIIYTKSISRFSRNMLDCVTAVRWLKELGVAVIFERENINTMDRRNELLFHIMAIIAEEESRSIGGNIKLALDGRHERGIPTGRVTYGYRRVNKKGEWRIEVSEARRVRRAFDLASKGIGYDVIRRELDEMEQSEGTGISWSQNRNRVPLMLKHIAYTGDYITDAHYTAYARNGHRYSKRNKGERTQIYIEGHHEPIVSKEQFARVQEMMRMGLLRSHRKKYTREQRAFLNDPNWK